MGPCFNKRPWKTQLRGLSKNRPGPIFFPILVQFFLKINLVLCVALTGAGADL